MKTIGGYFELADREDGGRYPVDGVRLNTSRNALEYIIRSIPDIRHIFLPLYTCEAVIQPFKHLPNIEYSFYRINERFEIASDIRLQDGEYLIANNYFGIKDAYINELAQKYGEHLIIDNAQALFAPILPETKAIYSVRKFVGVADGGFAVGVDESNALNYETDDASGHNSHLYIRKRQGAEAGFTEYQNNERKLDNQPILRMAPQTEDILKHIDYKKVITKRRSNYEYLHKALGERNRLELPTIGSFACPMVYPLFDCDGDMRSKLIENKVFVARYWPNVLEWTKQNDLENQFAKGILPLPIDQRYGDDELNIVLATII